MKSDGTVLVWDRLGDPHHVVPMMAPTVDPSKIAQYYGFVYDGLGKRYTMVKLAGDDRLIGIQYH